MLVQKKRLASVSASILALLAAALLVAGCGGGSSSGADPATLAPQDAPVYVQGNLSPDGSEGEELDELVNTVVGIEDIGDFIAEELEQSALGEGEEFNFEEEVEPWLGEKVGLYFSELEGEEVTGLGMAVETTNPDEAESFIEKRTAEGDDESEEDEFEGHKYWISDEGTAVGTIGDFVAIGETKAQFEEMVKVSGEEGLNESPKFEKAMEAGGEKGIGSVYVDIGGLIQMAGSQIPPETETFFEIAGIEPRKATAVATLVPHSDQIEVDLSTNLNKASNVTGDASALLESLPATAVAGFATPEIGKSLGEEIDGLDKEGIPGQIEPGELKPALESIGINLDAIAASLGDVAGFVEGSSESSLGGAMVIEANDPTEAKNTVANLGLLLRSTGTEGVTALSGEISGFSVRSADLGSQPVIVGSAGGKIVIAYGPKAAARALKANAKTLGTSADFEAAKATLGSTPISAFVAGGPALQLVDAMLDPAARAKLDPAKPYLQKITYVAVGSEAQEEVTTAKMIVGVQE